MNLMVILLCVAKGVVPPSTEIETYVIALTLTFVDMCLHYTRYDI